jgi:lipopolysaccharide transport system ATP-binding protein
MDSNVAIKVKNLTKIYHIYDKPQDRLKEALNPFKKSYHNDFYALNGINFEIRKGETIGIIGENGAGKSTLLKIITGVLTQTMGEVDITGKIASLLELGAGFNSEMTGIENIYLNGTVMGFSSEEMDNRIDAIQKFADINEFIHHPVKMYSSGMFARLAFSVAINIEPDILIVDEALSVGDAAFQRKCFAKMEEIREKGATILFVSHSEGSIISFCDRAIWLNHGEQVLDGAPKIVTGLYLKHSSTAQLNKKNLLLEYQDIMTQESNSVKTVDKKLMNTDEFYNPELQSESEIYYEEKGVKISNVKITTIMGNKVNILKEGNEYIYSYDVDFLNECENLEFGMLIKTKDGIELGGALYPFKDKENHLFNNKKYVVLFKFKCLLNSGEYFFNAGVLK